MKDVHDEINAIRRKYNIPSMRAKPVQVTLLLLCCPTHFKRNYAFYAPDVPIGTSEFLKVKWPISGTTLSLRTAITFPAPCLPQDISGKTFSHVFGTNTSTLEHIILKCRLKGPEWLYLYSPEHVSVQVLFCMTLL